MGTRTCAVTGASGFIGRHLVRRLVREGCRVRALSRRHAEGPDPSGVVWSRGDLARPEPGLEPFLDGVDVLFHCAGELNDKSRMAALHVHGTRRLARAASGRIGAWVQLSSCGVYGPVREGTIDEDSPLRPVGPYERTRLAAERVVTEVASDGGFAVSTLRPSIVFGGDMPNQSLRGLVRMVDRGMFFYVGEPGATTNYVHVANVVDALLLCGLEGAARGRCYNLSQPSSLEVFVGQICAHLGRPPVRTRLPLPLARWLAAPSKIVPGYPLTQSRLDALTSRAAYSADRVARELGYTCRIGLGDGIGAFVRSVKGSGDSDAC